MASPPTPLLGATSSVNADTHEFYRNTRSTLEGAWLRPRHKGYMRFQEQASHAINAALKSRADGGGLVDTLNEMFADSFR